MKASIPKKALIKKCWDRLKDFCHDAEGILPLILHGIELLDKLGIKI